MGQIDCLDIENYNHFPHRRRVSMFYIGVSPVVIEPQFLIKSPVYILFCSSFATSISTIIYWWTSPRRTRGRRNVTSAPLSLLVERFIFFSAPRLVPASAVGGKEIS